MGMMTEFKEFAVKGNVVDMAVGIIIGGAFGKIVSSFVADVVMPPIGLAVGGLDFKSLTYVLQDADVPEKIVAIKYGQFIQNVVDFLIIAFVIFLAIKGMNNMRKKEEAAPEAPAEPPEDVKLLREIRDSLQK